MGRGTKIGGGIGGGHHAAAGRPVRRQPPAAGGPGRRRARSRRARARAPACKTGADADARLDCRITGTVNSLNAFWPAYLAQYNDAVPAAGNGDLQPATNTGCGAATSEVGPFYCPADTTAYFDPGFFQDLVDRFGSSGGPLAQEYVVAHEFGHHIQNMLGQPGPRPAGSAGTGIGRRPRGAAG